MSWQEVTPVIGGAAGTMKRLVRYRVSKKFGAAVTVPVSVMAACGWKAGDCLNLAIGGGDDAGKLRLAKASAGALTLRKSKGEETFQIHLGRVPGLPDREVERVVVEHEATSAVLVIKLPAHAQAIMPVRGAPAVSRPATAKIDVIDKVVGSGPKPPRYAPASGVRGG